MEKLVEAVLVIVPPPAAGVFAATPMKKMRSPVVLEVEPPLIVIAPWPPLLPSKLIPSGLVRMGSIEAPEELAAKLMVPPPEILKSMM